jgi:hypothetical protein
MRKYLSTLALLLVLANLLFWAWSSGSLKILGWAPTDPREPQRVEEQLRPEVVRLIDSDKRP